MTHPRLSKKCAAAEEQEAWDYAAAIRWEPWQKPDWKAKNADIAARFSWAALLRIKHRAWRIIEENRGNG